MPLFNVNSALKYNTILPSRSEMGMCGFTYKIYVRFTYNIHKFLICELLLVCIYLNDIRVCKGCIHYAVECITYKLISGGS